MMTTITSAKKWFIKSKWCLHQKKYFVKLWTEFKRQIDLTLKGDNLRLEFQMYLIQLLLFNYVLTIFISREALNFDLPFTGIEEILDNGYELHTPMIFGQFGFWFRFMTVLTTSLIIVPTFRPIQSSSNLLLPCIIWSLFMIVTTILNVLQMLYMLYMSELYSSYTNFITITMITSFAVVLHLKLTLQTICFYEYLNYPPAHD